MTPYNDEVCVAERWASVENWGQYMGIVRLLLAVSVVLAHSSAIMGTTLFGGRTAVECFFVVSGFYMAMVLSGKYSKANGGSWKTFMASRAGRLLPVYFLVLVASAGAAAFASIRGQETDFAEGFGVLSIPGQVVIVLSNVTLLGQDLLTFTAVGQDGFPLIMTDPLSADNRGANLLLVPQAWSISIEIAFYVVAPFLLRLSTKWLVMVGIGSLAVRILLVAGGLDMDPWTYRFFPAELVFFILGAIAFRLAGAGARQPKWLGPALLGSLAVVAVNFSALRDILPFFELMFPFLFAVSVPHFFAWTKKNEHDRWVGELSYPLYLVHVLIAKILATLGVPVSGLTLSITSLLTAAAILVVVAAPLEKLRQRRLIQVLSTENETRLAVTRRSL